MFGFPFNMQNGGTGGQGDDPSNTANNPMAMVGNLLNNFVLPMANNMMANQQQSGDSQTLQKPLPGTVVDTKFFPKIQKKSKFFIFCKTFNPNNSLTTEATEVAEKKYLYFLAG